MSEISMTHDEAIKWFAELFGLPASSITASTLRTDISGWDSLGVLTLMSGLDETFGIVVNDTDMRAMKKVGDFIDLLQSRNKIKA